MQVHENRCIKRAGVAGLRERADGQNCKITKPYVFDAKFVHNYKDFL